VKKDFAPFHADASCRILPEGFISENYVECHPGTSKSPELHAGSSGVPTVARAHTAVPVSLQDVINIFSLPVDQRLRAVVNELGIGTAARGEDINAMLRRANPALTQTRDVLAMLAQQRGQLADAVSETDGVLGELARRKEETRRFVNRTAVVARATAAHDRALSEGVRRLPRLLGAMRSGQRSLDRATRAVSPALDDLRAAAPGLTRITQTLPAFTHAALPALRALGPASEKGQRAVRSGRPVVATFARLASAVKPTAKLADRLMISTRDTGGLEGLIKFFYAFANVASAYDETSHLQSIVTQVSGRCILDNTQPGCKHTFYAPEAGQVPINDTPLSAGPAKAASRTDLVHVLDYLLK
jgi:ABC-type transporter Mla subunit MlaD